MGWTAASPELVSPLYSVGHSTRSHDELLSILRAHGVTGVADVRRFPGSRRHPHFARDVLARSLPADGIEYRWFEALGGRRSRAKGAAPSPWRVTAFAAYADYMNTEAFMTEVNRLLEWAGSRPVAVMCAEAVYYRCHRRLISDWVQLHGTPVVHLMTETRSERHHVTPFARLVEGKVIYAAGGDPGA